MAQKKKNKKQKSEWTLSQKIMFVGVVISFFTSIISFIQVITISDQQVIIKQSIDEINATSGSFEYLKVENIDTLINMSQIIGSPHSCSEGYAITAINFSGGYVICTEFK